MNDYLHTKVSIPGANISGYLRYVGPIDGKQGKFCGVELIGPLATIRGKNNGEVEGKEYFQVQQPHSGLFLPYSRLLKANPHLELPRSRSPSVFTATTTQCDTSPSRRFSPSIRSGSPAISRRSVHERSIELGNVSERSTSLPSVVIGSTSAAGSASLTEYTKLQEEYNDLKDTHESTKRDMDEKLKILVELQQTVSDLQPVLEEYEYELSEKDKRFQRQKLEFEKARDEWRQSIDLMAAAQGENEAYYERRIQDLENRLGNEGGSESNSSSIISKLESTIGQLIDENTKLKDQNNGNLNNGGQNELERSKSHIASLEAEIDGLLTKVSQLEKSVQDSTVDNLGSMTIGTTEKDKLIDRLQHELEMRPTFEELSELQKSLDELDELHNIELDKKDKEINQLKDKIKALEHVKMLSPVDVSSTKSIKSDLLLLLPLPEPSIEITPENSLPIYKPTTPTDPSSGHQDWCGLCERSGHNSIDCPYENDMF
ncbi:uncharacterized protein KQ657_000004 [Scheffersomyces spartinae]|uniref:CAP-Gly domain-containing protein n=1 Tax=Scheffersomyces spartinae TaxID=45513 RepID=A0A9P7VEJ7_9ASCO|nr:uncharacterized protein KQ657_000004 [Scheffersomyces spartinae]KAG7195998.1 hypothetical protein KQ657_000004 [Scheffersomyces spartinae]